MLLCQSCHWGGINVEKENLSPEFFSPPFLSLQLLSSSFLTHYFWSLGRRQRAQSLGPKMFVSRAWQKIHRTECEDSNETAKGSSCFLHKFYMSEPHALPFWIVQNLQHSAFPRHILVGLWGHLKGWKTSQLSWEHTQHHHPVNQSRQHFDLLFPYLHWNWLLNATYMQWMRKQHWKISNVIHMTHTAQLTICEWDAIAIKIAAEH